jgi:predicted nucleotidyltransferase
MDLHPDFRELLAEFARCAVRFVVLGGYAVGYHAKPRATKDLDLLISAEGDNRQRAADALRAFGAPPNVVQGVLRLEAGEVAYFGVPPVRVDILRAVDGVDTEEVLERAVTAEVDGLRVPLISLDDLIANKRASGRRQDLADAELLERAKGAGTT